MVKLVIFVLPLIVLITPFSTSSPLDSDTKENSRVKRGWEDQIAEDLKNQMVRLTKDLQDVKDQLNNASSIDRIAEVQKKYDDMKYQLEDSYLKIRQVAKNLREVFIQSFDTCQKEMKKLQDSFFDRATSLEDQVQNLDILKVIESLQDGDVESAAKTFKNVSYPRLVITRVIKEAYHRENEKYCKVLLAFCHALEPLTRRPQALDLLLVEIIENNQVFSQTECIFGIEYQMKQLLKVIFYGDPLGYLRSIDRQLSLTEHLLNPYIRKPWF